MSIDPLFGRLEHRALLDLAQHWAVARGTKRMPAWHDIDPACISSHLAYVWAWRFDRSCGRFIGRLGGEAINELFGRSMRGVALEDFHAGFDYSMVLRRYLRVIEEPCMMRGSGQVFAHVKREVLGERLILPLSEDGKIADGVIGVTWFEYIDSMPHLENGSRGAPAAETEEYYPLD